MDNNYNANIPSTEDGNFNAEENFSVDALGNETADPALANVPPPAKPFA